MWCVVVGFVSVSEEQFLAMVLSDSLHQTIVLESSFGVVVVVGGGIVRWQAEGGLRSGGCASARSERGLMSSRAALAGCKKVHSLFSSRCGAVESGREIEAMWGRSGCGFSIGAKEMIFMPSGRTYACSH